VTRLLGRTLQRIETSDSQGLKCRYLRRGYFRVARSSAQVERSMMIDRPERRMLIFRGRNHGICLAFTASISGMPLHTVRIQGREGTCIFFDSSAVNNSRNSTPHVRQFEQWLGDSCTDCSCLLHAYNVDRIAQLGAANDGRTLAAVMLSWVRSTRVYLHCPRGCRGTQ